MNISKYILAATLTLLPSVLHAQNTQRLAATKANEYGLIYTLPMTKIDVTIEATKTVETPGEFFQYSKKYLNLDPIIEHHVSWSLKDVMITRSAVADESEKFLCRFKNGSGVFMMVTPESFPVSINDPDYNPALPPTANLRAVEAEPTILETDAARQAVTEDMLRAQSSAKRAELAAAKIYELRAQRNDIISGQAENMPGDGAAMKIALDNIDRQEKALTAMFVGTTSVSTEVRSFSYTPSAEDEKIHKVIARLSSLDGIVDANDLSGSPIYLDINVTRREELPVNEKGVVKTFPKEGFAYRIPGTADVSVKFDGRQVAFAAMPVAQFGVVFGIDPGLFTSKKAPAYLRLDPSTGAIVELGELTEPTE